MNPSFVHLRVHTEFSLLNGLVRIKPLINTLLENEMPAVAVTDQSNLFALVKYYKNAVAAGVKPIVGADIWLENEASLAQPHRMTLLAQNQIGYKNLIDLLSQAHLKGQTLGKATVNWAGLVSKSSGLIVLSGAREGDIGQALLADDRQRALALAERWRVSFPNRFYLELQRTGRPGEEAYLEQALDLAGELNLPVVATNDVQFLLPDDFEAHEARVCIYEGRTLDDARRARLYTEHQYFKSAQEMCELFKDIPEALENTLEIAKRCSLEIELGNNYLPNYPVPEGQTIDSYFRQLSEAGLNERLAESQISVETDADHPLQVYRDRLTFELDIISQMGFAGYFLIVMDFIRWAKDNAIPVGPGRGSGAGSLVAYALRITDLDPIVHDLLFERFLNPERVSMPDFDIDFCMDGRDEVIEYVANLYGRDAVSQIITFGTMAAKAVVRDVARVQGKPYGLADKLSKMIPFEVGMTLTKAVAQEPRLKEFIEQNDEVAEIWEMALKLEGITRNVGKHAGGVVIAPTQLTDFSPLYCDESGANLVTQYDKDDVEQVGLVKFDFLGLRTLTIIDWAVKSVNRERQSNNESVLDISAVELEDPAVYKLLQTGATTAIFQLESRGMKDLIRRLRPSSFEDVTALVALFRPGPLQSGMVDDFIDRKHGAKVEYPHEALEAVLKNTYGVILYQEQVMQIAQVLANYSLGQADMLRRAMGKKKPEEMAKQRQVFSEGAKNNGISEELAKTIFDLMEKFAGYGFNKSHSAAYALLSYQTAWLKHYYPAHFMAAVMSADMQNTDKIVILVEDCRQLKLELILPDVNKSGYRFTVGEAGEVVYGLGAIKGLGEGPAEAIIAARSEGGAYKELFDFCARVDLRKVNRRALEALIRAGAMDSLGPHRALMLAALDDAIKTAEQHAHNQSSGMSDLFGMLSEDQSEDQDKKNPYAEYDQVKTWPDRLRLQAEKDTLGLYLQGHPIDEYELELRKIARDPLCALRPAKKNQWLAGLVVGLRTMKSKRGDTLAFVTLDDRSARVEVSVFAETYNQYRDLLIKDTILVVEGEVSEDDYSGGVKARANRILDLVAARNHFASELLLSVSAEQLEASFVAELEEIIQPFKGSGCKFVVEYCTDSAKGRLALGSEWRLTPSDDLIYNLREHYGADRVQLTY